MGRLNQPTYISHGRTSLPSQRDMILKGWSWTNVCGGQQTAATVPRWMRDHPDASCHGTPCSKTHPCLDRTWVRNFDINAQTPSETGLSPLSAMVRSGAPRTIPDLAATRSRVSTGCWEAQLTHSAKARFTNSSSWSRVEGPLHPWPSCPESKSFRMLRPNKDYFKWAGV